MDGLEITLRKEGSAERGLEISLKKEESTERATCLIPSSFEQLTRFPKYGRMSAVWRHRRFGLIHFFFLD